MALEEKPIINVNDPSGSRFKHLEDTDGTVIPVIAISDDSGNQTAAFKEGSDQTVLDLLEEIISQLKINNAYLEIIVGTELDEECI